MLQKTKPLSSHSIARGSEHFLQSLKHFCNGSEENESFFLQEHKPDHHLHTSEEKFSVFEKNGTK